MSNATVDPIPGRDWNAHAVAGDILNRCPIRAPIAVVWVGEDGKLRFSKSNCDAVSLAAFGALLSEMAQAIWRDWLSE